MLYKVVGKLLTTNYMAIPLIASIVDRFRVVSKRYLILFWFEMIYRCLQLYTYNL